MDEKLCVKKGKNETNSETIVQPPELPFTGRLHDAQNAIIFVINHDEWFFLYSETVVQPPELPVVV